MLEIQPNFDDEIRLELPTQGAVPVHSNQVGVFIHVLNDRALQGCKYF